MRNLLQKRKESGFTIVEVMIVLAIAGLIILVVFLAVPALQRNSRNTQRNNDATRVSAAINECMSNNNGKIDPCDTVAELADYVDPSNNQQLITDGGAGLDSFAINVGQKCNDDLNGVEAGSARSYAVTYENETTGANVTRCIQ